MAADYYVSRKKRLLRGFDRAGRWMLPPLARRYGSECSRATLARARREYEALIPELPFIGGARNRWTANLIESAQVLALFRVMRSEGRSAREIADALHEGMELRLARYPRFLLRLVGRLQFSRFFLRRLRRQAARTQGRLYAGDFVAEVVIGDGREFDWGIDFTECAIQKFYRSHGAEEFLPHVCRLDYLTSAAFGLGMVRTKTLADGDDRCNARLKRGRATRRG